MYQQIIACRLCQNGELIEILDRGVQTLSNIFPKTRTEQVPDGPLKLLKCTGDLGVCGLLQLGHAHGAVDPCCPTRPRIPETGGSTTARVDSSVCPTPNRLIRTGDAEARDALAKCNLEQFKLLTGLPSTAAIQSSLDGGRVFSSSFSQLSTHDCPLQFLQHIRSALDRQAIWMIEEPYMPSMLKRNSYDSISHEQTAYYALKQIRWLAQRAGLKIVDIGVDDSQRGTISITLARLESSHGASRAVENILDEEASAGLHTLHPYRVFARRVTANIELLRTFLDRARDAGKSVSALGASRNGNVILQCCQATQADIAQVGETDSQKGGAFTPGTLLPIVAEEEVLAREPNFLLVLPWRVRRLLLTTERKFAGCNLLFPLPNLELVRTPHS